MKNIILYLCVLLLSVNLHGQVDDDRSKRTLDPIQVSPTKVTQSSIADSGYPYLATDGSLDLQSVATSMIENSPWLQIELDGKFIVGGVQLATLNNINDYLIVFSSHQIHGVHGDNEGGLLEALYEDDETYIIQCTGGASNNINIEFPNILANWCSLIIPNVDSALEVVEWQLFGEYLTPIDGGTVFDNGPNSFGTNSDGNGGVLTGGGGPGGWTGGPGQGFVEDCSDGIDNDFDGAIDCDDSNCAPRGINVWFQIPTCPICDDGIFNIRAANVAEISLDGGATWIQTPNPTYFNNFLIENLPEGTYDIVFRSSAGCLEYETVEIYAPAGDPNENCANGGLESGNFDNWTFGIGDNTNGASGPHNFVDENIRYENRHEIINSIGFSDPKVGTIIGPGQGTYFAKLGNSDNGHENEKLTYCLDVSEPIFTFAYAQVLENPDHTDENDNPFFYYRAYTSEELIAESVTVSNDPFLSDLNGIIKYKGWSCVMIDLSGYVGEEVCIDFVNGDCKPGDHWGYTYIDALCSDVEDLEPTAELNYNAVDVCNGITFRIDAKAQLYNQVQWCIAKIDQSGNKYDNWQGPLTNEYSTKIEDFKAYYESNSGFTLDCDDELLVTLKVFNDCGQDEDSVNLTYHCTDYDIDYCDQIIYCDDNADIKVQGDNNCDNCTYNWYPEGKLLEPDNIKFPTIDGDFINVYKSLLQVKVTTPEECVLRDVISFEKHEFSIVMNPLDLGSCSYGISGEIVLSGGISDIDNSVINIAVKDIKSGENITVVPTGEGKSRDFNFIWERIGTTQLLITVTLDPILENCVDLTYCTETELLDEVSGPNLNFHAYWKAAWPNVFNPLSQNPVNREFWTTFRSLQDLESGASCSMMNSNKSSIYSYNMQIFDRFGEMVFDQTATIDPALSTQGILGDELKWDGRFNGQFVESGVFAVVVTVQSCFNGGFICNDCGPNNAFQYCYNNENCVNPDGSSTSCSFGNTTNNGNTFSFDVTVLYL